MASRADLNDTLEKLLGNENVYYDPPESVNMRYPAIRYTLENYNVKHANNTKYTLNPAYQLILIDRDPDSKYVNDLYTQYLYISLVRKYTANGLHHWVFRLYQD